VRKPETPAQKSIRRRRQIERREIHAARLRKKYATNRAYRRKKIREARRQTKRRTTAAKGELAERRAAKRYYASIDWKKLMEEQPTILYAWEIEHPTYIVESPGRQRQIERW
jgi:hypothetical protein